MNDLDDLFSEAQPGEVCPECGSDNTEILNVTRNGFERTKCLDCEHDWLGDGCNYE